MRTRVQHVPFVSNTTQQRTKMMPPLQVVLDSLLGLQSATAAAVGGMSKEEVCAPFAIDLVEQVPLPFTFE
jgi:hypothetical protein